MSYKFSTGSVRRGDVYYEDDRDGAQTYIDFGQDTITLRPSGSAILYTQHNRVGIGTTSPSTTFHAYADASSAYVATIDNDAGSSAHGLKVTTDGTGTGTNILALEAASTTVFKVRGDGRVGIGVATPGSTLSVDDEIAVGEKLIHRGDANTYLQFPSNDNITLAAGGSEELKIASDGVLVKQYIKHDGDEDTLINFADDKIVLKAGNLALVTAEKKGSSPHEVTINDGSNNVDFVVKGNGSRGGNPGMKFDADTNKVGINGVGTPEESLHVDGNIKIFGDDVRIKIDGDTDSHPGLELYENGTRKWIVYNNYTNDNLTFKTDSDNIMSITQTGRVGIGTQTPIVALDVNGGMRIQSDSIAVSNSKTPSSASDTGQAGQICWDTNYLYVCVALNTWKRIALSSW